MRLAIPVLLLALCACNGPKSSPEGSVKAYFRAAHGGDFAAMAGILAPQSLQRLGSPERAAAYLANDWEGWEKIEAEIQESRVDGSGKTGIVRFTCGGQVKGMDRRYHDGNCSSVYSVVKGADDLWYIVLPETQKVRPL